VEAIDLYRLEVAFAINRNWAFADQLARDRGEMVASIVFKVMPDGRIEDIFFTDRSGNPYLDESAYRAIVKSSPVRPHPSELKRSYIEMGLRFTPKGVQ
jgi:colicin import membrane protein